MDRDRGQVSDLDMILWGTCEGTVSVGPCRGHCDGEVNERRLGGVGGEGVTTVTRAR